MSDTVKALVTPNEWNWEAALEILVDNWFDVEGARVVTLTRKDYDYVDGGGWYCYESADYDRETNELIVEGVQE